MSSNKRTSVVWDHFTDIGSNNAVCKICKAKLSYKASVTNLKKHLQRKHVAIALVNRNENVGTAEDRPVRPESEAAGSTAAPSQGGSRHVPVTNDNIGVNEEGRGEGSSSIVGGNSVSVRTPRRTYGQPNIQAYVSKRRVDKKKIDALVMQLFTLDFQPFRMVEDRGFRELMNYAFPGYVIPTRKYFANNLLPAMHEQTKATLIEQVQLEASHVCITADVWSSITNDSFLAMTGHYITDECELRTVLLDCVPVERSHSAENLATIIKSITDEWHVTNKVSMAVSDNGANIKRALQTELGWPHFSCYAHGLNLAVKSVIEKPEMEEIIGKGKEIVRYFKKSNLGWKKLKTYQEQAGQTPLRPLQAVQTRWNSVYYMLHRLVTIKEFVNSALINLNMPNLTAYEWQIYEGLCQILKPCEEATKEISGQKYVSASLVIPITTGLLAALERIGSAEVLMPAVDQARQDLIAAVNNKFPAIHRSRTFGCAMFLDPRFKLYFPEASIADDIKRRIRELVTQEINRQQQSRAAPEPQQASATEPAAAAVKTIWVDFHAKMQNVQPEGTAQSRAIVEVQRYFEDAIIPRDECPLTWWRNHRNIYPNIFKVACKYYLSLMASSVPCERVFSTAGNMMTDRRSRLGVRKLQQLVFLHENCK